MLQVAEERVQCIWQRRGRRRQSPAGAATQRKAVDRGHIAAQRKCIYSGDRPLPHAIHCKQRIDMRRSV